MPATFSTSGVIADVTILGTGPAAAGNGEGGLSTGIGFGPANSGSTAPASNIPTVDTADVEPVRIGGGALSASDSNLGSIVNSASFTAGSGYTDGTYEVQSSGGGRPNGEAAIEFDVSGGAITAVRVKRAGARFTSAPTFTVANAVNIRSGSRPRAGTGGAITVTVGTNGRLNALGTGYGTNKGIRRTTANGASAVGAAVPPSTYLNRSGRAMVSGEFTVAVAP